MLTRSMIEILGEASAGAEIPPSDVEEGRVSKIAIPSSSPELLPNFLVHGHSSTSRPHPNQAFAAVPYRNYWFWVDAARSLPNVGLAS